MRVTKRLMAALLACLMLLSLLPVPAYAADDGRIALLAVTQDGYVIEPEYIGYRSGDTVKDVLKNSGHTFSGIDSGFITAVDGRTDNYSLHYDGDGYALDASAKGLTAIWFTTNANQSYGDDLLHLAERMAAYNTSTNGLKDYAAAKEAYDAAHSGFYAATNAAAAPLRTALEKAIDKFEAFQAGDRVTVTIAATQDGSAVTPAQATFTSEFGTVTTVKNAGSVQLVPATYQFDLSDGGINHVRGTVEVTAQGAAVSAPLPSGKWIKELRLGIDNQWKDGEDVPKFDETDGGATFWVPDYSYGTLYPYMVPGDGIGTGEGADERPGIPGRGGDPAQVRPLLAEQGHGAEPGPSRQQPRGRGRGAGGPVCRGRLRAVSALYPARSAHPQPDGPGGIRRLRPAEAGL